MDIKKFTESFFTNLKSSLSWQGNILVVDKVPKEFESFCGKKAPYYFAFDRLACPINQDVEIMDKGSVFIKAMSSFLENRAQTTLLKLDFPKLDLSLLKLKNCKIMKSSLKEENKFIFRFTFNTTLQYLNEKEQLINSIFVSDSPTEFSLEGLPVIEGKKSEVSIPDIKEKYEMARKKVRELINPKVEEISNQLQQKLSAEILRIKSHYQHQFLEIDTELKKNKEQLAELEAGKTSGDIKNIPARINKLKEQIEELEKKKRLEDSGDGPIAKEEKFFLTDEDHKHSLNLDNKLLNTTIIYSPLFHYSIMLKSEEAGRQIELIFDPLKKQANDFFCEACNKNLEEIYLCSSGHITCAKCQEKCRECGKDYCTLCLDKTCDYCGKKTCRKCSFRCAKCGKNYCKTHTKKTLEGKQSCISCTKSCSSCGQASDYLRKCTCGASFCSKCSDKILGQFCISCSQKCQTCQKLFSKKELAKCPGCKAEVCNHIQKCMNCRKQLCPRLRR